MTTMNDVRDHVLDVCWVASNLGSRRGRATLKDNQDEYEAMNKKLDLLFVDLIERLQEWIRARKNGKNNASL